MTTEDHGWDTPTTHVRRTLLNYVASERGRSAGGKGRCRAVGLLGTALHMLEDLLAHRNWRKIALKKMGHAQVSFHVVDRGQVVHPLKRTLTDC